jgi:hypothetical protein
MRSRRGAGPRNIIYSGMPLAFDFDVDEAL